MLIEQENIPQVAMAFMNETHTEDVKIINDLYALILAYETEQSTKNKEDIDTKYEEWTLHTIEHFRVEEEKMLNEGFPPYPMHKSEHENALVKMDTNFRQWQNSGDITALKHYIGEELPGWLSNHIATMDTVTAMFFQTKQTPCALG
jgi:hemerythrin